MKKLAVILIGVVISGQIRGQYFQFSQYNFTDQRINPAFVALSDFAQGSLIFRRQTTAAGFNFSSNFFNASYPLIAKNGVRWSGIGLSFMDDRSGNNGLFQTQEAALSYAINIPVSRFQTISLGTKFLYQSKQINQSNLFTGSQYVVNEGFDRWVYNGEDNISLKANYASLSFGLHWQQVDKTGDKLSFFDFSFFDFNKPRNSFLGGNNELKSTAVMAIGNRVYKSKLFSITPEALFTHSANTVVINVGLANRYNLPAKSKTYVDHVVVLTKFVPGRSAILGFQLHREFFSAGLSYDFPTGRGSIANTGAIEVAICIKKLMRKKQNSIVRRTPSTNITKETAKQKSDSVKQKAKVTTQVITKQSTSDRLKHKQDSVVALAKAGDIAHEPLILEKTTLHFNFDFNSSELDEVASDYLRDLAKALNDNPLLKIKLEGHTDNIGGDRFNQKLSLSRAQAIKDFILKQGVDPDRIVIDGKGSKMPLNSNRTEEERALNRRVELTVFY